MANIGKKVKSSRFARILLIPFRAKIAFSYYIKPFKAVFSWLIRSKEYTNFTYDIDGLNKEYLAAFISSVTGAKIEEAKKYIVELEQDPAIRKHIATSIITGEEKHVSDKNVAYGRRLGWYALLRIKKSRIVVETGIDKGFGSCVIAAALMKNAKEGYKGYMYGTDIKPDAGHLFSTPYSKYGKLLYGDSVESLKTLSEQIDLFIHDSNHSAAYEKMEYKTIEKKLSEDSLIISDNAHSTKALYDFAMKTNRNFLFFQEKPEDHWYPGGGIGVAFRKE